MKISALTAREGEARPVNTEETPGAAWTAPEENVLLLARELEWAEAYSADHPDCPMGNLYRDFLHWEMVTAQAGL